MHIGKECVPYSLEACENAAKAKGKQLGGNGYEFAGSSYGEKGCYSYKSESSKYYGIAWYGLGGDKKKISKPYDKNSEYFRPEGYDCVVKSNWYNFNDKQHRHYSYHVSSK